MTALPKPRGPLSVALQSALLDLPVNPVPSLDLAPESPDDAEDEPEILRLRRRLEQDDESSLRQRWPGMPALEAATVAP